MPAKKIKNKETEEKPKNVLDLRKTQEKNQEEKKENSKKKSKRKGIFKVMLISFVALIVLINGIFAYGIYQLGWSNQVTYVFTKVFPYPAAMVGLSNISVSAYYKDLDSYKNYYEVAQNTDFSTEEGQEIFKTLKEDLLNLLIEEEIIAKEAKKLGIKVDKEEVEEEYSKIKEESGEETLKKQIEEYYKWDTKTFKKKIESALLRKKLEEEIKNNDGLNKEAKEKSEEVLAKLKEGADFAELAKEYSEDPSAEEGGSLGWFERGVLAPDFEDAAFELKKGELSDVVKTEFGYHIIIVNDTKENQVNASHILIRGADFTKWLENKKEEYKIRKFLPLDKINP